MSESQEFTSKRRDAIDLAIMRSLADAGRKSIAQVAEEVGLTETPCARRIRQLEASGAIRGYAADINPEAIDRTVSALVFVELKEDFNWAFDGFVEAVERFDCVQSCHYVAGDMDFVLYLRVSKVEDLETFARKEIGKLDMVRNFHTLVCIREVFDRPSIKF